MSAITAQTDLNSTVSSDQVTGQGFKRVIQATVTAATVNDSSGNSLLTLTGSVDYLESILGSLAVITGMSNAHNDGIFTIIAVDTVNSKIKVINPYAVAEAGSTGLMVVTQDHRSMNVANVNDLVPEARDAFQGTYDGSGNLTVAQFYVGGLTGMLIATLTMTYDGSGNLLTCVRS